MDLEVATQLDDRDEVVAQSQPTEVGFGSNFSLYDSSNSSKRLCRSDVVWRGWLVGIS